MSMPTTYKRVELVKLSKDFRAATEVISSPTVDLEEKVAKTDGALLLKNTFCAANASDVAFSSGFYNPGKPVPYTTGIESLATVVKAGPNAKFAPGDSVAVFTTLGGGNSEYMMAIPGRDTVLKVPSSTDPKFLAAALSGLTASLALEKVGHMKICKSSVLANYVPAPLVSEDDEPEIIVVTAAVGGTGLFCTQYAVLAGNRVIGTCGTPEKEELLKKWGVERAVNYKTEDLGKVLKAEYPEGIDIAYESVGGKLAKDCALSLREGGRFIVIGSIETYKQDNAPGAMDAVVGYLSPLTFNVFLKSIALAGFFLPNFFSPRHMALAQRHMDRLSKLVSEGKLDVPVDDKNGALKGVESCADAVEHLHTGLSVGKVVVRL